jgi:hypothetical protein
MKSSEKSAQKQSMKYWLVEITLTSGEILSFYVKALTHQFAYEKADEYAEIAENNNALKALMKQFRLLP